MSTEQTQIEAVVPAPADGATAAPAAVETSTPVEQTPPEGQGQQEQTPTKTFTQEELDRIVAKEKARAKRQAERELRERTTETKPTALSQIPADQLTPEQQVELLAEQKAQQKLAEREATRQTLSIQAAHEDREDEAREKYPDYDRVTRAYNNYAVTNEMAQAIVTSQHGPDIQYHLASNPDESIRIAKLSPVEQIREIGKIEAKLAAKPATPVKTVSSAPAPIVPVTPTGTSRVVDTTDPRSVKDMSTSEWIAADRARRIANLQAQRKR